CGTLLGTVTAVKENYHTVFVGTDIGFNTLLRPAMYDSYHEIDVVPAEERNYEEYSQPTYVVGPICESGDILAYDRAIPCCHEGDALIVHDTGAYGFAMASTYNSRPLPAEVLIEKDGGVRLIRKAQTLQELWPD
ncbi:MAG: diaminopimelate decarboxylase, partial [Syntrophomonadaceae bacterium]|nr:diaminopimelate decarboxylase [Syntrophomonadaceae bacterium]